MNFKKISLTLALFVLILPLLSVSASAATSFQIPLSVDTQDGTILPAGMYKLDLYVPDDASTSGFVHAIQDVPIEISYSTYSEDGFEYLLARSIFEYDLFSTGDFFTFELLVGIVDSFCFVSMFVEDTPVEGGSYLELTPVEPDVILSDVVSSDVLSAVMDEVVAITSILLIAIVCFIGIRKGITFLMDSLHKA